MLDNINNHPSVRVDYENRSRLDDILLEQDLFAAIGFDGITDRGSDQRLMLLGMPELGTGHSVEVWRAAEPVTTESHEGMVLSHAGDYLFGSLIIDDDGKKEITGLSEDAYTRLVDVIRQLNFPHLLRMWNFFPAINTETSGLERYQQFCHGRHNALEKLAVSDSMLPAASTLGTHAPGFAIYFLATKEVGVQIENPRQISAFYYPQQYAPRSPSFSRAVYKQCRTSSRLYISGTASIVGHETRHVGDIEKQLDETLKNIEVLIEESRKTQSFDQEGITPTTTLKIYLRRAEDESLVHETLGSRFGHQFQYIMLNADICRQDLLVEIEGTFFG